MLTKEYIKENICRDICDTLDKYGRDWQDAVVCNGDIIDICDFFEEDGGLTDVQANAIRVAFKGFMLTLDKVFNEIK